MPDSYVTGLDGMLYCNQTLFLSRRVGSGHETSRYEVYVPVSVFHKWEAITCTMQSDQLTELLLHRLQVIIFISMSSWSHEGWLWHANGFSGFCLKYFWNWEYILTKKATWSLYVTFLVTMEMLYLPQSFDMVARQHGSFCPAEVSSTACLPEVLYSNPTELSHWYMHEVVECLVVNNSSPILPSNNVGLYARNFYLKERSHFSTVL